MLWFMLHQQMTFECASRLLHMNQSPEYQSKDHDWEDGFLQLRHYGGLTLIPIGVREAEVATEPAAGVGS